MCSKIWYDEESWKVFGFRIELNKALDLHRQMIPLG